MTPNSLTSKPRSKTTASHPTYTVIEEAYARGVSLEPQWVVPGASFILLYEKLADSDSMAIPYTILNR